MWGIFVPHKRLLPASTTHYMTIKKGDTRTAMLGGLARANALTAEQRSAIARKARAQRTANYNNTHKTEKQLPEQKMKQIQGPTAG